MFHRSHICRKAGLLLLWTALGASSALARDELPLAEAERLALEQAPWYAHHRTNVQAAAERTVSEGRLPDPQLTLGALNVPTDNFSLDQEDMTMLMVGVRQAFPPGNTLALRARRAGHELNREQARLALEERNLRREVRRAWLELYYASAALEVVARTRPLVERQLRSAEGRYRAAQDSQQAVLQARQALARLSEREHMLRASRARSQAMLARWIGAAASRPLPAALPAIDAPVRAFTPEQHPDLLAAQAGAEMMRSEVDMARQEYRPGIMFDLSYGFRRASPAGMERPDMLTAMVTFDLPIFRAKRQDRRLAESQARETGARHEIEDRRRDLVSQYESVRAEHDALLERVRLFEEQILPFARREAQVTVAGFARDQAMLRESQIKAFDVELELTRLRVELARARADLRYFTGEPQS
jgi:outer membrane protein TolC